MNLSVEFAPNNSSNLRLKNPVMLASGTCGYITDLEGLFDIHQPGAFACKGTTLKPRDGNHQPRIAEVAGGMLNAIGLENIGINEVISNKAPAWQKLGITVIVNIAGSTTQEYAEVARKIEGVSGIAAVELNISCPNVKAGGVEFGLKPDTAAAVTRAVRQETRLPLFVKLSPGACQTTEIARAVIAAGADGLTLINTFKGMAIDIYKRKPVLGNTTGGVSGPILKPAALAIVYEIAGAVNVPIIACGGISNASDGLEFIMAGASAFQVGTAFMINPSVPLEILKGIRQYMEEQNIPDINQLIGCARR